jgi:hypothetical protein
LLLKISDVLDEDLAKEIAFDEVPFKEINRVLLEWYEDGVTDYLVQLDFQVLNEIMVYVATNCKPLESMKFEDVQSELLQLFLEVDFACIIDEIRLQSVVAI